MLATKFLNECNNALAQGNKLCTRCHKQYAFKDNINKCKQYQCNTTTFITTMKLAYENELIWEMFKFWRNHFPYDNYNQFMLEAHEKLCLPPQINFDYFKKVYEDSRCLTYGITN